MSKLLLKPERAVERETARKWMARAVACWRKYGQTGETEWRDLARDYGNEAVEHAAMVKDYGKFVGNVQRALEAAAKRAETKRKRSR